MRPSFLFHTYIVLMLLCVQACTRQPDDKISSQEQAKDPGRVELTEEQFKATGIELGSLEQRDLVSAVKANGTLELPPQNKASVSSFVGGAIKEIFVIQGDYVRKGQTLANLEHPDVIQLQEDYVKAKSNFAFIEKDYLREKELFDQHVAAEKKFQLAESDYKSQAAVVNSLEHKLSLLGLSPQKVLGGKISRFVPIRSPIDGYVNLIEVNTGSFVDPAKEIFRIVDNHHIHIDLHVYEKDLGKVKEGQKITFKLSNAGEEEMTATIFAVGKAFDPLTKSVAVHADIKNNKRTDLMPGMYVEARISSEVKKVNALPDEAIVSEGTSRFVFVYKGKIKASGNHVFERTEVIPGASDTGYTEVVLIKDKRPGNKIVTKGAYYLEAQLKKEMEGEEE